MCGLCDEFERNWDGSCIACGKPVLTEKEGRIHDECYTPGVVMLVQDNP